MTAEPLSTDPGGVPSPLGLLARLLGEPDREVAEVLVLTYNADLGFFERAVLGFAQTLGARITIVGDAAVAHHDLYAVRHAGSAYLPGLAVCGAAFHPKLIAVVGPREATVVVGSGNLTSGGWGGNDELWSLHHATADAGSPVVAATGDWLASLPAAVVLSDLVPDALQRVARHLGNLAVTEDDHTKLVHNIKEPILEQLPSGPVDELSLSAPFHDSDAQALRGLIDRFQPTTVLLGYQPGLTLIDQDMTTSVIGPEASVIEQPTERYRHGKLIEWSIGDRRWALTGSPNLTTPALARSISGGGNVELGVIAPVGVSLLPDGASVPARSIKTLRRAPRPQTAGERPGLLSAVAQSASVLVRLIHAAPAHTQLQVSPAHLPPDHWSPDLPVPTGSREALSSSWLPAGSRVRLLFDDGSASTPVFVIDPVRIQRAHVRTATTRHPPTPVEVLTDPQAAERFYTLVQQLRREQGAIPLPATRLAGSDARTRELDWEDYLDACRGRYGVETVAFALGLPDPTRGSEHHVTRDWDEEVIDSDDLGALDEDSIDDAADMQASRPSERELAQAARARYRAWVDKIVNKWPDQQPHERLLVLRLSLCLVAAGAWQGDDNTWELLVATALGHVADLADLPEDVEIAAASLAALALSILAAQLPAFPDTARERRLGFLSRRLSAILSSVDRDRVEVYASELRRRFPVSADPDHVIDHANAALRSEPLVEAASRLEDAGLEVRVDGPMLTLPKRAMDPLLPGLLALSFVEDHHPAAVRVASNSGWTVLLWAPPDAVLILPAAGGRYRSSHYRLSWGATPRQYYATGLGRFDPNDEVDFTLPGAPLCQRAVSILQELGLTREQLLADRPEQ